MSWPPPSAGPQMAAWGFTPQGTSLQRLIYLT